MIHRSPGRTTSAKARAELRENRPALLVYPARQTEHPLEEGSWQGARPQPGQFPRFWVNGQFTVERVNDVHLRISDKRAARKARGATTDA